MPCPDTSCFFLRLTVPSDGMKNPDAIALREAQGGGYIRSDSSILKFP